STFDRVSVRVKSMILPLNPRCRNTTAASRVFPVLVSDTRNSNMSRIFGMRCLLAQILKVIVGKIYRGMQTQALRGISCHAVGDSKATPLELQRLPMIQSLRSSTEVSNPSSSLSYCDGCSITSLLLLVTDKKSTKTASASIGDDDPPSGRSN